MAIGPTASRLMLTGIPPFLRTVEQDADALSIRLTAESSLASSSDLWSLGGYRSIDRATWTGTFVERALPGISVEWASGPCADSLEAGRLEAVGSDAVRYMASGDEPGDVVPIAPGEVKQVASSDPTKYLIVARQNWAGPLAGQSSVYSRPAMNTVLAGGGDIDFVDVGHDVGYAVMLRNQSALPMTNLKFWIEALGDEQVPSGGSLPAAGPGYLKCPDLSSWNPYTRFVRIKTSGGALREIVGGYRLAETDSDPTKAHWFYVPAAGRGMLGTAAAAGLVTDRIWPVPGIRLAKETPIANAIQRIALNAVPTGLTWYTGTSMFGATNLTIGTLAAQASMGLWIRRQQWAGQRFAPLMKNGVRWSFDLDGVHYELNGAGYYRVSNDHDMTRYRVYRSLGDNTPVDLRSPVAQAAARPLIGVPVVSGQINNVEAYEVSDHGLMTRFASAVIRLNGSGVEQDTPPSAAQDLAMQYQRRRVRDPYSEESVGCPSVVVRAVYFPALDATVSTAGVTSSYAADKWQVAVTNQAGVSVSGEYSVVGDVEAWLEEELSQAGWAHGDTLTATVAMKRSSNGVVSAAVIAVCTADDGSPTAPSPVIHMGQVSRLVHPFYPEG